MYVFKRFNTTLNFCLTGSEEDSLIDDLNRLRNTTVDELWDVTCCRVNVFNEDTWRNHVNTQLIEYQKTFVDAVRRGYDPKHMDSWSFSGAFLYSLTVITTIGMYLLVIKLRTKKFPNAESVAFYCARLENTDKNRF